MLHRMEAIEIGDFLVIAERVTGVPAEHLARNQQTVAAAEAALGAPWAGFGDVELHPTFAEKAAVYASRIVRYHPLVDGNKRVAWVVMREFIARNSREWMPAASREEEAEMIERLAASQVTEAEFTAWVTERIR